MSILDCFIPHLRISSLSFIPFCDNFILVMAKARYTPEVEEALARDAEKFREETRTRAAYSDAYEAAKRDLTKVIGEQQKLEKRKLFLRRTLENLAALCESEGVNVEKSPEATNILDRHTLATETKNIVQSLHPNWTTPHEIKAEIEKLGHDLSKYKNPQAAIQTVLTRMVDAGEAVESWTQEDEQAGLSSKRIYRFRPPHVMDEAEAKAYEELGMAARLRKILEKVYPQSSSVDQIIRKLADTGFDMKSLVSPRVEIERALEGLALSGEITDYSGDYSWNKPKRQAAKKPPAKQ